MSILLIAIYKSNDFANRNTKNASIDKVLTICIFATIFFFKMKFTTEAELYIISSETNKQHKSHTITEINVTQNY